MAVAYVAHVVVAAVVPHTFQILGQNMPEFCRNLGFFSQNLRYNVTNHWPFQDPKLEVPTIYKAYVRPM